MMKMFLCIVLVIITHIANAQSKKEQIESLTISLDSLSQVINSERSNFNVTKDSLNQFIEKSQQNFDLEIAKSNAKINDLISELNKLTSINDSINIDLNNVNEEKIILNQEISTISKSVDSLKQQILELGNNTSINSFRNSSKFENFLFYFFSNIYSKKNIDSLIYVSSPTILNLIDKNIGFGRFWNMGASCSLFSSDGFGYNFYENYFGETEPEILNLSFLKNQKPKGGFCEEASSPNGIYYSQVDKLPEDWDMEKGESIPTPQKLKYLKKFVVEVQYDSWIVKTFYFVESNNKWFLLYIDDCDCGA